MTFTLKDIAWLFIFARSTIEQIALLLRRSNG